MSTQTDLELTLRLIKDSLDKANTEPDAVITDTILMLTGTETVFDALDRAIESVAPLLSRIEWLEAEKHSWQTYAKGLNSRIDALSKDAEWQPIETAPRDCAFLGYQRVNDDIWIIAPMYLSEVEYLFLQFHSDNSEHVANPTHWKPIPKPPAIDAAISAREGE